MLDASDENHLVANDIAPAEPSGSRDNQFSLQSILWLITGLALLLAYAQSIGDRAHQHLMLYLLFGLVAGVVIGMLRGEVLETLFWSLLTNLLVYLAVAGGRLPSEAVMLAWGGVGAVCGALCGAGWPRRTALGIIVTSLAALVTAACMLMFLGESIRGLIWFDIVCAACVGLIFRPAVDYLKKLEKLSGQPRIVLAVWLSITILIGNWLVPIIGQVQR